VNGSTSQHEFLPFVRRFATVYQRREYGRLFKSLRYRNLQKLNAACQSDTIVASVTVRWFG